MCVRCSFNWVIPFSGWIIHTILFSCTLCLSAFFFVSCSLSGGHVVGRFPPHEAFAVGGINSVRGYEEGAVGSGRSYAVGIGEPSFRLVGC